MNDVLRAGWGKTRIPVRSSDLVVDIGSGAFPNDRADLLVDMHVSDNVHRNGNEVTFDGRPFLQADVTRLPFRDRAVDFVIVSHLAEHVDDPSAFCAELTRSCQRGYIETPSPLGDVLLHEDYHLWRVGKRRGELRFVRKGKRGPLAGRAADLFYAVYNAGEKREKRTFDLPTGLPGRILDKALWLVRGSMNRSGVMITRVEFGPTSPLRWSVRD